MYPPIIQQKAYGICGNHPVSERVGREGLWLPSANQLTDAEIDRICGAIRAFYEAVYSLSLVIGRWRSA